MEEILQLCRTEWSLSLSTLSSVGKTTSHCSPSCSFTTSKPSATLLSVLTPCLLVKQCKDQTFGIQQSQKSGPMMQIAYLVRQVVFSYNRDMRAGIQLQRPKPTTWLAKMYLYSDPLIQLLSLCHWNTSTKILVLVLFLRWLSTDDVCLEYFTNVKQLELLGWSECAGPFKWSSSLIKGMWIQGNGGSISGSNNMDCHPVGTNNSK